MPDKYSATWISHSSLSAFLTCPRSYYLRNVYKDPATGHKIQIMTPPLALGQAVHEVVEALSVLKTEDRFKTPLHQKLDKVWARLTGKSGGFSSPEQEQRYRLRGEAMLARITAHPGPLLNPAVKIKEDLPWYWLSEADNIILCGKIDWLEYLPESDSVHILDFKTSKNEEDAASLQLPIYLLLASNCQRRPVAKASYWYLERQDEPTPKELPDEKTAEATILAAAKKVKVARSLERFICPTSGCPACTPFERILRGEGQLVGTNHMRQDIYILPLISSDEEESIIL